MRMVAIVFALLLAGCTPYEFDITSPPGAIGHVPRKENLVRRIDPIEYRFQSVDNRLVLQAYNLSNDSLRLLGGQSSVVDPSGQSRRLDDQAIASHSFMKLILPPMRPVVERTGPSIGVGVGGVFGDRRGFGGGGIYDDGPQYFRVMDAADYWDWNGETAIRLSLVYQDNAGKTFTHDFAIQRVKADKSD